MTDSEDIAETIAQAFSGHLTEGTRVRELQQRSFMFPLRRLFQVQLPRFGPDGDVEPIYVRESRPGWFHVTDLGMSPARMGDEGRSSMKLDEQFRGIVERCGFRLLHGEVLVEVPAKWLVSAAFGLLRVTSELRELTRESLEDRHADG